MTLAAPHHRPIRIVALTQAGEKLARRLQDTLGTDCDDCAIWFKPKPFAELVQQAFSSGNALILICAAGIAVRTLAPVIRDKRSDPPVLVLDEAGEFVIPLLSGHEGGANQWATAIAEHLQAQAVITTANRYQHPLYAVGMGCERNCPMKELELLLQRCIVQAGITMDQVASINSIDIKQDEAGLVALARALDKPFHTFSANRLSAVEDQLSTRSQYVFDTVGVYGVAESAALTGATQLSHGMSHNNSSELVLPKQKTGKATCAIARIYLNKSPDRKTRS